MPRKTAIAGRWMRTSRFSTTAVGGDLQRAADLGANAIRYSVPWYRAEPKPGIYDWSWIDAPVEHLVTRLQIIPVLDILHYGAPTWMEDGLADDRFADALTAYTAALTAHFRGLLNHYTPQNQPQLNLQLCAGTGRWPPYADSREAWSKLGVKLARTLVQQSRAIRQEAPEAGQLQPGTPRPAASPTTPTATSPPQAPPTASPPSPTTSGTCRRP